MFHFYCNSEIVLKFYSIDAFKSAKYSFMEKNTDGTNERVSNEFNSDPDQKTTCLSNV